MTGSPSNVISFGLGSWGSVNLLTTLGFGTELSTFTLVGQWTNVIDCISVNQRAEVKSANTRIDATSGNDRTEAKSANVRIDCYSLNERLD